MSCHVKHNAILYCCVYITLSIENTVTYLKNSKIFIYHLFFNTFKLMPQCFIIETRVMVLISYYKAKQ